MSTKILSLLAVTAFLTACGTPYQPIGTDEMGGYYQQKHRTNYYTVGFSGNGFSKPDEVYDYTMLRAAELGIELGFKYFIIEGTGNNTTEVEMHGPAAITATPTYDGGFVGTVHPSSTYYPKPGYSLDVRYYDSKPNRREGKVYGVTEVYEFLTTEYGIEDK